MPRVARAFWLHAPGEGEIRTVELPRPGTDEVLVRTLCSGVSRGTETLVFRGGVPREPVRHDAGAVPGRRLPRARQIRLPQRRRGRGRATPAAGPYGLLPLSAPDALRRPGGRRDPRAGHRPARPGGAGRHGRDRGERRLGRRTAARRPDRGGGRRDGRVRCRGPARPVSRRYGCSWSTRTRRGPRSPRRWASASRCPRTPSASATSSCTPAPPKRGWRGRWSCSPRRARSSN